jgi:hypothetical protein
MRPEHSDHRNPVPNHYLLGLHSVIKLAEFRLQTIEGFARNTDYQVTAEVAGAAFKEEPERSRIAFHQIKERTSSARAAGNAKETELGQITRNFEGKDF